MHSNSKNITIAQRLESRLKHGKPRVRLTHRLAILIIVSVSAALLSGFYAGAILIRQIAELSNDASLVEALASGKKAVVELNHVRQSWAEQVVALCLANNTTQNCKLGEYTIRFTPFA